MKNCELRSKTVVLSMKTRVCRPPKLSCKLNRSKIMKNEEKIQDVRTTLQSTPTNSLALDYFNKFRFKSSVQLSFSDVFSNLVIPLTFGQS